MTQLERFFKRKETICLLIFSILIIQSISFHLIASYESNFNEKGSIQIGNAFGVCHGKASNEEEANQMTELGVQISRNDLTWAVVERESGIYNFEHYDKFYSNLTAANIESLIILDYGNAILFGSQYARRVVGEEQISAWLDYVNATVNHYLGIVKYWEIWNEPNLDKFWDGTDGEFFTLMNQTMRLIKSIDPNLKVLAPGISGHNPEYLQSMIEFIGKEDFNEYVDVLNFHPYSGENNEELRQKSIEVKDVADEMQFEGEVWITEVGFSTQISSETTTEEWPYKYEIQGNELIKVYAAALAEGIDRIIWYCYADVANGDVTYGEHQFGLIYMPNEANSNWVWKPSAYAFNFFSEKLTNGSYYPNALSVSGLRMGSTYNDYFYHYLTEDNHSIVILWTQNTPYSAEIRPTSTNSIKTINEMNLLENTSVNVVISGEIQSFSEKINSTPVVFEIEWIDNSPQNLEISIKPNVYFILTIVLAPSLLLGVSISLIIVKLKKK